MSASSPSLPFVDAAQIAGEFGAGLSQHTHTPAWRQRALVRAAFRRSLYITVKTGICFHEVPNKMGEHEYRESCEWLQWVVTDKKRGLFEDPRGHMKTTRATRGIPVWYAIQRPDDQYDDPSEVERASVFLETHPHLKGPDGRLIIASDSKDRATRWVGSTKADWTGNPFLRWAFPELAWPNYNRLPGNATWTNREYTLNGRTNAALSDPYLSAVGLESKEQGGRAEGILVDDLVGETSYRSPSEIERRRDWVRTIGFLLENRSPIEPEGGFIIVIGNRWSLDDVNSMIHTEFSTWDIWRRSALRCSIHDVGNCGRWGTDDANECTPTDEPLWKERYPTEASLRTIVTEASEDVAAAQLFNDPTRTADLDAANFMPFTIGVQPVNIQGSVTREWSAMIDPADDDANTVAEVIPLVSLHGHCISIDPASSKEPRAALTAVSWFALDRTTDRVFWLDCRADRWGPDEAVAAAYDLYLDVTRKIRTAPRVLIEKVAAQGYMATALTNYARVRSVRMSDPEMIRPAHGASKEDRIRRRVGYRLNQRLLYLRAGLPLPRAEARRFPTGTCDALDTAAQAEEIFAGMVGGTTDERIATARRRRRRMMRVAGAGEAGVSL